MLNRILPPLSRTLGENVLPLCSNEAEVTTATHPCLRFLFWDQRNNWFWHKEYETFIYLERVLMQRPTSPSWLRWKSMPVKKESKVGPLLFFIREIACTLSFSENTSQRFYNRHIITEKNVPAKSIWPLTKRFTEAINNTITIQTQNNIRNQTKIQTICK